MKIPAGSVPDPSQLGGVADQSDTGVDPVQGAPTGQAAPTDQAQSAQAPTIDRTGGPPQVATLMHELLKQSLDLALPGAQQAPPAALLELLKTAIDLFRAIESDPETADAVLKEALYNHGELCDCLKQLGSELRRDPQKAVLQGTQTLADATGELARSPAGERVKQLLPQPTVSGRSSDQSVVKGSRRGSADTALGRYSGGVQGRAGAWSSSEGRASLSVDGLRAQGHAEARAGVAGSIDGHLRSQLLNANARLSGDITAYAEASGRATIDRDGLRAQGHAEVGVRAQAQLDADFRTAGCTIGGQRLDLNGQVHAVAEASARASVDADVAATVKPPRVLCNLGAEAFAGAKAGVDGSVGIGSFIKLSGHAEAWAGAGAEAGIQLGYDDGKLSFGFNFGAAVGYGAGAGFGIEIDVKAIAQAVFGDLFGEDFDLDDYPDLAAMFPPVQIGEGYDPFAARRALEEAERAIQEAVRVAQERAGLEVELRRPDGRPVEQTAA